MDLTLTRVMTRAHPLRAAYTATTSSPFSSITVTLADTYFPLLDGLLVTSPGCTSRPSAPVTSPTTSATNTSP
eukprot:CAMPEP_0181392430 /NCGR_PEP_ID=MMETSP1106-20121128/26584_1 /TAXON_ID=81844 /ORGANISM="Mantoniella antarctica, Strain SL-175" /LENGTH=72 /DNA_ID=CAMNT_0023513547 /DNA_START=316 /DNA_END=531 /DNA_ORIENTATION=+